MKTGIKLFLAVTVISLLSLMLIGQAGMRFGGIGLISALSLPFYFFLTLITIKFYAGKLSPAGIALVIFLSMIATQFYTIYICFVESINPIPILFIYCIGIFSGYIFAIAGRPASLIPIVLSCVVVTYMCLQGWSYWFHLANFGTFTGRISSSYTLTDDFVVWDRQKNVTNNEDLKGKVALLDFWYTHCGVCFAKFPQLQKFYEENRQNESLVILAVNRPVEDDKTNQAFDMIGERNYTFPVVIASDPSMPLKFGVKTYPTTLVVNPQGQVVYRGDIAGGVQIAKELSSRLPEAAQ